MIFISHRGNLNGVNLSKENHPDYILKALEKNFDVEVDVWFSKGKEILFLGHDKPQYKTDIDFLKNDKLWCHAKNVDALNLMLKEKIHCFWHQEDDVTLTSKGYIWTYPNKPLTNKSICVLPETDNQNFEGCAGVCSDYIEQYKKHIIG
ncbi:MAG: hypothetical protein ACFFAO_13375 [Candidatus Hermodarchaeota archaeon]